MSGNPFRRAQGSRLPDESTLGDAWTSSDTRSAASKAKVVKKKKKVVIQTPPHSPEERNIPRHFPGEGRGQPAPVTFNLDDGDTDSTATVDSEVEEALASAARSQGDATGPSVMLGGHSGTRAPYNPFAKTLATSEASFGLQSARPDTTGDVQAPARPGNGRPAMDVDAFKNILLTGSATPTPSGSSQILQRLQDSSSNSTETSSISRQSIFDSMQEAHPESPRTSMDYDPRSPRADDFDNEGDDDDDESQHSSLLGPQASRPVEEGPPAPPKHKHGRAFPQTVSFADFDESIPAGFASPTPRTPPVNAQRNSILRLSLQRSPSDLNKPLPEPPEAPATSAAPIPPPEASATSAAPMPPTAPSAPAEVEQVQAKKVQQPPPPPPASRRQGQGESQGRPRSSSNLSRSSAQTDDVPSPIQQIPTSIQQGPQSLQPPSDLGAKIAPAPPPSRRKQASSLAPSPSPSADTPSALPLPDNAAKASPPPMTAGTKAMPPPPPRRSSSKTGTSATRTPSTASRNSFSASQSPGPSSGQAPPAPPPRRGVPGSKRSSFDGPPKSLHTRTDHRRTSGQSFDSERSLSASSLTQVDEPGESVSSSQTLNNEPPQRDILADLTAFQAEIDALRAAQGGDKA